MRVVIDITSEDAPRLLGEWMPSTTDDQDDGICRFYYGPDEEHGSANANAVEVWEINPDRERRLRDALETLASPNRSVRPTAQDARDMAVFASTTLIDVYGDDAAG